MSKVLPLISHDGELSAYPPPQLPLYEQESGPSPSSSGRISSAVILVIVILAAVFFVCGLVHLLVRFLMKQPSSSIYQSDRFAQSSSPQSHVLQRQLQQLFRLHDSGLDQACIDALPVFYYKDIIGLKEPFDCPVCLCEFSDQDKLRLLPICSHAFHINCIDTWLLSNSTCPLCRGALVNSGLFTAETPLSSNNCWEPRDMLPCDAEDALNSVSKRVFSVRLGKFRSLNEEPENGTEIKEGEGSSRNLDARRCYSMGSYQYVVGDLDFQVVLSPKQNQGGLESQFCRGRGQDGFCLDSRNEAGKKIIARSRGDSFSISKIWLWPNSKNSNSFPDSPDIGISMSHCNASTHMQNDDSV
ncbi:RING-H2 finger protein ATL46-like [Punica granatum]|uniref:RING-type E3 ubiquitin transferase n=2 Tax=Punica granatum TaxID=22663 RepID=A0A218VZR3_PUNGR|nr:RING-H2 finger protein ATL46-like [Punica granatum]OWM65382.1 hypothetical protein CDL15_Pgr008972 [Punica granatum]PKI56975.1 hypothetical protein CRG98_022649 [Punica granatum]